MYKYFYDVTMDCGCKIEVNIETDYGCCDEYCSPSSYPDEARMVEACAAHNG